MSGFEMSKPLWTWAEMIWLHRSDLVRAERKLEEALFERDQAIKEIPILERQIERANKGITECMEYIAAELAKKKPPPGEGEGS